MHCILGIVFHTQKRRFYNLLHTDAFYTLLHTGTFTTQKLSHTTLLHSSSTFLHTNAFTHRCFYTTLLHTDPFAHRRFYTQKLLHRETLLHIEAFACFHTHKRAYTQTRRHTDDFTHRKLLHIDMFAHGVTAEVLNWQFYRSLWRSNLISGGKVAAGVVKS